MSSEQLKSIRSMDNMTLIANIVGYKSLGLNKERALQSMQELSRRRKEENLTLDYESLIDQECSKVPKVEEKNISMILSLFSNISKQ
jgi:hypothetical protein